MPHPICIYTGTEQGRTHRTGFAPGGKEEVNTYMTLQKHKPVQHKSQLTHCQNTLRQIAKNNPSLCQPHTHIHTQTLKSLVRSRLQKTEAGQILWCKNRGKKKISERQRKRNKERVIHPIVSFHNPHSFSSPVFCFSAQTTSWDPLLKIPVCIYVCVSSIQVELYQQHLWQKHLQWKAIVAFLPCRLQLQVYKLGLHSNFFLKKKKK